MLLLVMQLVVVTLLSSNNNNNLTEVLMVAALPRQNKWLVNKRSRNLAKLLVAECWVERWEQDWLV